MEAITKFIKSRKMDLTTQEKIARQQMFLDPKKRGKWLAIDSSTGLSTSNPKEVKRIYLQEGAAILKAGIDSPLPFHPDHQHPTEPPPDLTKPRQEKIRPQPEYLPKWWNNMYDRKAKGITEETWKA